MIIKKHLIQGDNKSFLSIRYCPSAAIKKNWYLHESVPEVGHNALAKPKRKVNKMLVERVVSAMPAIIV